MTITVHETLRYVFWAIGFSAGLIFFPVWVFFLLHMVPQKNKAVLPISRALIAVAVIIAILCVFLGAPDFAMTTFGTRFSYSGSIYYIIAMVFTSLVTIPLVRLQYRWWSETELLRYKKMAKMFVVFALGASSIGFVTDFILPIFTKMTFTPLGAITILSASMITYFLMFSAKTQRINVRNVSGFAFASIRMPILILDRKNNVGLENKAATDFFGKSHMEENIASIVLRDGKSPDQSFFDNSFINEVITVESPLGIRTCEMMLTVEHDKLGDTIFKVVVIRDRTESYYKDSLLESVNQVSGILLEPDIGYFEMNLYMAMGMMAKAVDVDRVYVWENDMIDGKLLCTQIYEWSEGAKPQQGLEHMKNVEYDSILTGLEEMLSGGQCLNLQVNTLDESQQVHFTDQGIYSSLVAPVFIQERFWGFVGVDDCRRTRVFTENEENILLSASRLIVNAMIRNDMTHKLDTALTDELTGARSRRYYIEKAEDEIRSCIEEGVNYAVIIIDVDFFKKVNDTYGHPVGDDVLRILVSRIRNTLKLDTLLARFGGEEFIVSLCDMNNEDVIGTAERLRESIENDAFKIKDLEINVTISLGVAFLTAAGESLSEVISNADKALYKAKQTGRNKVVSFEE